MSTRTQGSLNPTLTNYAQGVAQDVNLAVADFLSPVVPVVATIGAYKTFNNKNAFMIYDTARGLGGSANRIKFAASDGTFNCKPQALEIAIDDAERAAIGASDPLRLEQSKVRTLVISTRLARENKVITAAKAGLSAVSGKGEWSSANVDPQNEIDEQIAAIATACGMMPNRILFGLGAWRIYRNNPKIRDRFPGAAVVGVTLQQAASLMLNPAIEPRVAVLAKDTTKLGQTKSASNILGDEVFIFIGSGTPTEFDPSLMKTFEGGEGGIAAVREYRDESARSDVYAVDYSEDVQVVGSECGRRLTIT